MEGPTDTEEASIPTEPERMIRTLKRKAAKRTCFAPSLPAEHIKSSPDVDIPARKKPRLQALLPAIAAEADSLNAPPDAIPAIAADVDTLNDSPDAIVAVASPDDGTYPVAASPMQSNNDGAARVTPCRWTPEEDTKLTTAIEKTCKKKRGKEYKTDWVAIAALGPGRTKKQCCHRWHDALHSKSDETTARKGKWTKEEDVKLTDAVKKYNGADWAAISALVPGRTNRQCYHRWHDALHSKSDKTTERKGKWTAEEDSTLKDAAEKHNGTNWAAIAALVPGRTTRQCRDKWVKYLDPSCITITEEEHGNTNEASALG
jgi:hypothetical protein